MPAYDKHYKSPDYFGDPYPELVSFFNQIEPKGHVLDLGCGQGRDSIALARMGYKVTGVDISKVGINQLQSIAAKEKLDIKATVADMYEYQIGKDVDIVLLDSMLHFYPKDREKETRFLVRVMDELKPEGLLCVLVWRSKKLESVLESIIERAVGLNILKDKYIEYPEKKMEMRMLVLKKER